MDDQIEASEPEASLWGWAWGYIKNNLTATSMTSVCGIDSDRQQAHLTAYLVKPVCVNQVQELLL